MELYSFNPNLTDAHRALTDEALSQLPDGVFFEEDPTVLPGIPMTDYAVLVNLTSDISKVRNNKHDCKYGKTFPCKLSSLQRRSVERLRVISI